METKTSFKLLLFILLLGSFLRFYHLSNLDIWEDEAYQINLISKNSVLELINLNDFDPGTPQTYIILFKFQTIALGVNESAVRVISAIAGILSIFIMFKIGKFVLNENFALIASFLLSISPMHIYYSQNARPYSCFFLISLLALYFLIRFFSELKKTDLIFCIIFSIASCYIHYFGLFLILFECLIFFILFKFSKINLLDLIFINLGVIITIIPTILLFLITKGKSDVTRTFFNPLEIIYSFLVFVIGETGFIFKLDSLMEGLIRNSLYLSIVVLLFLYLVYSAINYIMKQCNNLFLRFNLSLILGYFLFVFFLVVLISFYKPMFRPRYLISLLAPFIIFLSLGIYGSIESKKKFLFYGLIIGVVFVSFSSLYTLYFNFEREPWRKISDYVATNEKSKEVILGTEGLAFKYYYKGNLTLINYWQNYAFINRSYQGVWLIYANYNQGDSSQKKSLKKFLDENFQMIDAKEFIDDSNELSGNIYILHYLKT
jgi:uncharacterized membrane protein